MNLTSKFSQGEGDLKRTPRPVPKFYDDLPLFSTKKALQRRRGCREENLLLNSCLNRTAPPLCRVNGRRFSNTPAQFISFKSPRSFMGVLSMIDDLAVPSYDKTKSETYLNQSFIIYSKIGQGSFGEVFKVKSKADNKVYAVKRSIEEFRSQLDRQAKLGEVEKHESLPDHPNLLKFICAWEEAGRLYIQTELCYQTLASLSALNHSISERFVWQCMIDLLEAVKYLHDHSLVHMDIKPANIFLTDQLICKLGDFGLVYNLNDPDPSPVEGDAKYLAPELLHSRPTTSADMFSLGITLLEVACDLNLPNQHESWHALRQGLLPWDIMKDKMTPNLQKIIVNLLQSDPSKRHSATQLLQQLESTEKEKLEKRRIAVHSRTISNRMSGFWSWMGSFATYLIVLFLYPLYHFRLFKRGRHTWNWKFVPTVNPLEDANFDNRAPFKIPFPNFDTSSSSDATKEDKLSSPTDETTAKHGNDSRLILSPIEPKKETPRPFSSTPDNNRRYRARSLNFSQNIGLEKWDTENEGDSAILRMNDERNASRKRPLICRSPRSSASRNHQSPTSAPVLVPKSFPVTSKPFESSSPRKLKPLFDQFDSSSEDENSY